jgi:hypothetical protein
MADKFTVLSFLRSRPEAWLSASDIASAVGDVPDRTPPMALLNQKESARAGVIA